MRDKTDIGLDKVINTAQAPSSVAPEVLRILNSIIRSEYYEVLETSWNKEDYIDSTDREIIFDVSGRRDMRLNLLGYFGVDKTINLMNGVPGESYTIDMYGKTNRTFILGDTIIKDKSCSSNMPYSSSTHIYLRFMCIGTKFLLLNIYDS